jgi:hypothetical protein
VAEAGEEGLPFRVQLQADLQQPVGLHRAQAPGLEGAHGLPPGPPGQLQGEAVGEDLPWPSQLGEPLGQDHGGAQGGGVPRLAVPQGGPEHLPAGHPHPGGKGGGPDHAQGGL